MNILVSTFGVRGDVQPYLALAVGFKAALGEKTRAEDGVARAVEIVERHGGTQRRAEVLDHEGTKGREGWNTNARRGAKARNTKTRNTETRTASPD